MKQFLKLFEVLFVASLLSLPITASAKDYKLSEAEKQLFLFDGGNSLTELFAHQCMPYAEKLSRAEERTSKAYAYEVARKVSQSAAEKLGYEYRAHSVPKLGNAIELVFGPDENKVKKKKKPFWVSGQIHGRQCLVQGLDKNKTSVSAILKVLRAYDSSWSDVETKRYQRPKDPEDTGFIVYFCQKKEEPIVDYHVEFLVPDKAMKKGKRQPSIKLHFSKCNISTTVTTQPN